MNEISTIQQNEESLAPLSGVQLRSRLAVIQDVMRTVMMKDQDFGIIPGTDKPSLFKPGAEKLCVTFRLSAGSPEIEAVPEYTGDIRYRVRVPISTASGVLVSVGVGECSTGEEKYRWRRPVHINEFNNAPEDMRREKWQRDGSVWQQVRVNPSDVANTVLKMAHKRAYVHGVIMATAAGAIFTQDIEDLPEGVEVSQDNKKPAIQQPQRRSQAAPSSAKASTPPAGAGTVVRIGIRDITSKDGQGAKGPWTRFTIFGDDGKRYSTFDTKHNDVAKEAMAGSVGVEISYTEDQYGRNIQTIAILEREPGEEG